MESSLRFDEIYVHPRHVDGIPPFTTYHLVFPMGKTVTKEIIESLFIDAKEALKEKPRLKQIIRDLVLEKVKLRQKNEQLEEKYHYLADHDVVNCLEGLLKQRIEKTIKDLDEDIKTPGKLSLTGIQFARQFKLNLENLLTFGEK